MKKKDLKDRMVVELDNEERFIVAGDRLMAKNSYILLDNFDDDLMFIESEDVGIQRVYEKVAVFSQVDMSGLRVLWERPWKPEKRDKYYIVEFANEELFAEQYWTNAYCDNELYNKGLVFKTKEEAIECAKKMLKIAKEGV